MSDEAPPACAREGPHGPPRLVVPGGGPGEDRFWLWRDHIAAMWDIAVDDPGDANRFQASAEVLHLGTGILARSSASGHLIRRTSTIVARMGVDHVVMQVRRRGTQIGRSAETTVTAGPGDIVFLDTAQTYAAATTDYEAITLAVPRALFDSFPSDCGSPHALVLPGATPLGRLLAVHLAALLDVAPTLSPAEASAAAAGAAALAATCCRPLAAGRSRLPVAAAPAVLLAIRRYIEARLDATDLSADGIALRFGLSRSALYRLFEPLGGVADYVRKRRLATAYAKLARTANARVRPRIADVAGACGFESGAAFSRAFRREFGFAPREMQFAAGQPTPALADGNSGAALHEWLVRLAR